MLYVAGLPLALPVVSMAQAIRTDGMTQTAVSTVGAVTSINTNTKSGNTGFNSFNNFSVGSGQTVNMYLPGGTANLVNIVRDTRSDIFGTLNSIKDGQIGGNLFFANPNGFLVGAGGVINAGSLSLTAPTKAFVDGFFLSPGIPDSGSVGQLLSGNAPIAAGSIIRIDGRVNTTDGVRIAAGSVVVGGSIYSGARFTGSTPDFTDVVNANGIAQGSRVVQNAGRIFIAAADDISVSGTIDARGSAGTAGGDVTLRAGRDIAVESGATITAAGDGAASDGGRVDILAQRNAVIRTGALLDASAGAGTSTSAAANGGFVEFSAKDTVELAGGELRADGVNGGAAGTALVDPANIVVSADILRSSASAYTGAAGLGTVTSGNLSLLADDSITVNAGVTISSRQVAVSNAANHKTAASTGDSGNITLNASSIVLKNGSSILANADSGYAAGDVTLTANKTATQNILGYREGSAKIEVGDSTGGATVKGRNVSMTATTTIDNEWLYDDASLLSNIETTAEMAAETAVGFAAQLLGANLIHSQAVANSSITLFTGSNVEATNAVTLHAENTTSAGAAPTTGLDGPGTRVDTPLGLGLLYARNSAQATVDIKSGATVKASSLEVSARNNATIEAEVESADPGADSGTLAIALGIVYADINSRASVASGANIKVTGDVSVTATNVNSFANSVTASQGNGGKASAAIAISELNSSATAELNANVKDAANVTVLALNQNLSNVTTSEAKVGETLTQSITAAAKDKLKPLSDPAGSLESVFWDKIFGGAAVDEKVQPTQTSFRIGGAITWVDTNATASATIGANANVHATGNVIVAARTTGEDIQSAAIASAVSQAKDKATGNTSRASYSAGVDIANYTHDATATIGAGAIVTGSRIAVASDVILPVRESLINGGTFDKYDNLETLKTWFDQITSLNDVFNGQSAATSTADNSSGAIALSGSISILNFKSRAHTEVQQNAQLNVTGSQTGTWTKNVVVTADDPSTTGVDETDAQSWNFASAASVTADRQTALLFHGGKFTPTSAGAGDNGKGLGLAYTQANTTGDSLVYVREGAKIQGMNESASAPDADGLRTWTAGTAKDTDAVTVAASGKDLLISIATTAGYGASFGINGAATIDEVTNNTRAIVDDEATLRGTTVSVTANDSPVVWSIAGGFSKGESAAVGVGIAYTSLGGTTEASIADNDTITLSGTGTRASAGTTAGLIKGNDINVIARALGHAETIAVTGSAAVSSDDKGGFFTNIKSKYDAAQTQLAKVVGLSPGAATSTGKGSGSTGSQGTGAQKPTFGLSGAGSAAVNDVTTRTTAKIDGATIDQTGEGAGRTVNVLAVSDLDIVTASGAAALTRANSSSQSRSAAITGSVAVNMIDTATAAYLNHSTLTGAQDVSVNSLAAGEQLSVAVGMAIDASNQQSKSSSVSLSGSLSLSFVDNLIDAGIDGSTITGDSTLTSRDLDVTAYNRMFIGTGGGTLSIGGKTGVGAAVTYTDVNNTVNSIIKGTSTITALDSAQVRAYNATEIGAGAASGALSGAENGNSLAGAVVITEITNNTTAAIQGLSTVNVTGNVTVEARDRNADTTLENIIEPGTKRENTVTGLDYCGRDTNGAGVTTDGNCITSVAGVLQASKGNNVGISFNWSAIDNNLTAKIEDSNVKSTGAAGTVAVTAQSDVAITSLALGVGASNKVSGVGSVAVNFIDDDIYAGITTPANNALYGKVDGATVTVQSSDKSRIDTLAGAIALGKSAAVGAAVAYSEIGDDAKAQIEGAIVTAPTAINVLGTNDSRIRSLAVAGTVALGSNAPAISASISVNFINNNTEASSTGSTLADTGDGNAVKVFAQDTSEIQSLAGSIAVSAQAGVGGAFAYDKIGNTTLAAIDASTITNANTLTVESAESSTIKSLAMAASGGQTAAISGSVTLNQIGKYADDTDVGGDAGNVTTARITGSTITNTGGDTVASVYAHDDSQISSFSGAAAFSGDVAVGGAIGDNVVRNTAKAQFNSSSISGATSLAVEGKNTSLIQSASAAGAGAASGAFAGSASSNRIDNTTTGEVVGSDITGGTADVSIKGTDSATIKSAAGGAAIGGSAAVGAGVAVNRIDNNTNATLSGKKTSAGQNVTDMLIRADSLNSIETLAVGLGGGVDVGVGGSVAVNLIGSNTRAVISDGALVEARDNVGVIAEADDKIKLYAGAAGVGIAGAGVGAAVAVNSIDGTTEAAIRDSSVAARAKQTPGLTVNTGDISGIDGMAAINAQNSHNPFVTPDLAAARGTETVRGVSVNAASTEQTTTVIGNIGGGLFAGIAATVNVSTIGGETKATITDSTINGGDNSTANAAQALSVKASDHALGNTFIGNVAVGAVGVGMGSDTNVFSRTTSAIVDSSPSTVKGAATVYAASTQGVTSIVVGAGAGAVAVVGSGTVGKFTSTTQAYTTGSNITAASLNVLADHETDMFTAAGSIAGGGVGVSGAFAVGLDNSTTTAYIDGGTITTTGQNNIKADSTTDVRTWAVGGAGGGTAGVAGSIAVAMIGNTTTAYVQNANVGTLAARSGSINVKATDSVSVTSFAGSVAGGGIAGVGAGASVVKVDNTTGATIQDTNVYVSGDIGVEAAATRNTSNVAAAAGVGGTVGIGGAAAVTILNGSLSSDGSSEVNKNGSGSLSQSNSFSNSNKLSTDSSSGNLSANSNLSQSKIDAINAKSKVSTTATIAAAPKGSTTAAIVDTTGSPSVLRAGGNISVKASELDKNDVLVGGLAVGGLAGVGAAVGIIDVRHNVSAYTDGSLTMTSDNGGFEINASVGRLLSAPAVNVKSFQASGGFVGVGAAVSKANLANSVSAKIGDASSITIGAGGGDVLVKASDSMDVNAEAQGYAIGAVAAGIVVTQADKSGNVSATIGETGSGAAATTVTVATGTVDVQSARSDTVTATAQAGAGGVAAGSGAEADASATGTSTAAIRDKVTINAASGDVNLNATSTPQINTSAKGFNGALYLAIGVSQANSNVSTQTYSTMGSNNSITAGALAMRASTLLPGANDTAHAYANATGGSLLVGANGSFSTAASTALVNTTIAGNNSFTIGNTMQLNASNFTRENSQVSGVTIGGLLAIGANIANATSNSTTLASIANGNTGSAGNLLSVVASGTDETNSDAKAGSGGIISGAVATASTRNKSDTQAILGGGTSGSAFSTKTNGSMQISADHTATFNSKVDSLSAGVVGASGGVASNDDDAKVVAGIAASANLQTWDIDAKATNTTRKDWLSGGAFNVNAGAGGLLGGAAGASTTTIDNITLVSIGDSAKLFVLGDPDAPGTTNFTAVSDVIARDMVKLEAGGAISAADAESTIAVNRNPISVNNGGRTSAVIGNIATIDTVGDFNMSARDVADVEAKASSKTWGLAAFADGYSKSDLGSNVSAQIGTGTDVRADGYIYIGAGRDALGVDNAFKSVARTDLYNNAVIPISGDHWGADAYLTQTARILVNGSLRSVLDVSLQADKGFGHTIEGRGVAKDLYTQAASAIASGVSNLVGGGDVSIEVDRGNSVDASTSGVTVNGLVDAGIRNQQIMTINEYGTGPATLTLSVKVADAGQGPQCQVVNTAGCTYQTISKSFWVTRSDGMPLPTVTAENLQTNLLTRINSLIDLRGQYSGNNASGVGAASNTETVTALTAEINFLQSQLESLFPAGGGQASVESAAFLNLAKMSARGGNIDVVGDFLAGGGTLTARGDAQISVTNNSSAFLRTDALTIPEDATGRLTLNGTAILNVAGTNPTTAQINTAINARNTGGTANFGHVTIAPNSPVPSITILNTFVPTDDTPAPDIEVVGNISNLLGSVTMESTRGSVVVKPKDPSNPLTAPNISAATINITAGRDFVYSSPAAFYHTAGAPQDLWGGTRTPSGNSGGTANDFEDGTATSGTATNAIFGTGAPTIAGNNIFISARYLNINGLLQSGVPDKSIGITSSATVILGVGGYNSATTLAQAKINYDALVASGQKPANPLFRISGTSGNIVAFFNAESNRIELEPVKIEGGKLDLVGEILNTGGGAISAMDGYGKINITNSTGYDLVLNNLDTGNNIEGRVRITDFLRRWNGSAIVSGPTDGSDAALALFNSYTPVTRVITRLGTNVQTSDFVGDTQVGTTATTANTRTSSYSPTYGETYTWVTGQRSTTKSYEKYEKETKFWFFGSWDISDRTQHTSNTDPTPLSEAEYTKRDTSLDTAGIAYKYARKDVNLTLTTTVRDNSRCSAFFCIWKWNTHEVWTESGDKRYNTHTVRGDYAIPVNFIGYDVGSLNVASAGNVIVAGSVINRVGTATINNTAGAVTGGAGGAISSDSTKGVITSQNIVLNAKSGIGTANVPLQIDVLGGGITATTASGDIGLKEMTGDMRIDNVSTNAAGKVYLEADQSIVANGVGAATRVTGGYVDLMASNGSIGTGSQALYVSTQSTLQGGLNATAVNDINITQTTGDLRLNKVESLTGDVTLTASNGKITDGNSNEVRDTRAEADLDNLWTQLRLRSGQGAEASLADSLATYKALTEREYQEYWTLRGLTRDQTTGTFTANAYNPLTASARLIELNTKLSGAGITLSAGDASSFNASFSANVTSTSTDPNVAKMSAGYAWTDNQVRYGVSGAIYSKATSDTETRIEQPNVVGRNIVLNADSANGGIGKDDGQYVINIANVATLTTDQRVALAAAEADDVAIDTVAKTATILKRDDLDISTKVGGSVTVNARGHVYLGADSYSQNGTVLPGDVNIKAVDATGGGVDYTKTIRIKASGGIFDASMGTATNLRGGATILESASSSIGTAAHPLSMDLGASADLIARASTGLWLKEVSGVMNLAEIFTATGGVHLTSQGGFNDDRGSQRAVAIQTNGGDVEFNATTGSVGAAGDSVLVSVAAGGVVNATASGAGGDVYVSAVNTTTPGLVSDLSFGTVTANDIVSLSATAGKLQLKGNVTAGNTATLVAGTDLTQDVHNVQATNAINISAGRLIMADGAKITSTNGAVGISASGDVVLGRVEATNSTSATAIQIGTTGRVLDGGDMDTYDIVANGSGAGVVINATGGIGNATWNNGTPTTTANALETSIGHLNATANAGGVYVSDNDGLTVGTVSALNDINVRSGGTLTATQFTSGGRTDLNAVTGISATNIGAGTQITANVTNGDVTGTTWTAGQGVQVGATQDALINTITATAGASSITATRTATIASLTSGGASTVGAKTINVTTAQVGGLLTMTGEEIHATTVNANSIAATATAVTGTGDVTGANWTSALNTAITASNDSTVNNVTSTNGSTTIQAGHDVIATALVAGTSESVGAIRNATIASLTSGSSAGVSAKTIDVTTAQVGTTFTMTGEDIHATTVHANDIVAAATAITGNGDITGADWTATRNAQLTASHDVLVTNLIATAGSASVQAGRNAGLTTLTSGTAGSASAGDTATIDTMTAGTTGSVSARTVDVTTAQIGTTLALTGEEIHVDTAHATDIVANATAVTRSGDITGDTWITSGSQQLGASHDVAINHVTAGGQATLVGKTINVTDLTAGLNLNLSGEDVFVGNAQAANISATANAITGTGDVTGNTWLSFGDVNVSASDDMLVKNAEARNGVANITTGRDIDMDSLKSAGNTTLIAGRNIRIGNVRSGQSISATASTADIAGIDWLAQQSVDMKAGNDILVTNVTGVDGSTFLKAQRDIIMDGVTAGSGVSLDATTGSVAVKKITGDILFLSAKKDLALGDLNVGTSLSLNSDSVTANIIHTKANGPLLMTAVGKNGDPARWVDLTIDSAVGAKFDQFNVMDGRVNMKHGYMIIDKGYVQNRATFMNPVTNVYMDNTSLVLNNNTDVQLWAPSHKFNGMYLNQYRLITDAYVVTRDPLHEVIMNDVVLDWSGREQSRELVDQRIGMPSIMFRQFMPATGVFVKPVTVPVDGAVNFGQQVSNDRDDQDERKERVALNKH